MTSEPHLIVSSPVPYRTEWIPAAHHALVVVGEWFDAVRVVGQLAVEVADALAARQAGGAIVRDARAKDMHFLVEPGTARSLRWPPGIRVADASREAHVGIPALWGNTYPLSWRSLPTRAELFVDVTRLHEVLCEITGFQPIDCLPPASAS